MAVNVKDVKAKELLEMAPLETVQVDKVTPIEGQTIEKVTPIEGRVIDKTAPIVGQTIEKVTPLQDVTIGAVDKITAGQVADVADAKASQIYEDPTIRNRMVDQSNRLEAMATGKTPSIAEMQFRSNLDRILKSQAAQSAQVRGGQNSMLAQRETNIAGQNMMAESAREASILRMEEQK